MDWRKAQQRARELARKVRYLAGETPRGEVVRLGAPGVTFNAGRNAAKRKLRQVRGVRK